MGRAVALKLALDGYDVVCCTSSDERFASVQRELAHMLRSTQTSSSFTSSSRHDRTDSLRTGFRSDDAAAGGAAVDAGGNEATGFSLEDKGVIKRGRLLRARRVDEGVLHRLWVVGKYDTSVR